MISFKELAEMVKVSRPSIGRIIKREEINTVSEYDPTTRKITKYVSDEDSEKIVSKYKG